jgi:hypothetical protein
VNFRWSRARALLLAVVLIVVTNAVVLAGVAYNRSGDPEAVLRLTERELQLRNWSWPSNENSSIDLDLSWRIADAQSADANDYIYGGLHWLEPAQLRELGFYIAGNLEFDEAWQRVARQPSRRVWLVLEYDGPAHQASVEWAAKRLERAAALAQANPGDNEFQQRLIAHRKELERRQRFASRLFVIDAALDQDALRVRYPDRQHYVIVRGRLDLMIVGQARHRRPVARVADIDVGAIRVPYTYRHIVEPFTGAGARYNDSEPRFAATVHFGQRFEPWIVDLEPLQ